MQGGFYKMKILNTLLFKIIVILLDKKYVNCIYGVAGEKLEVGDVVIREKQGLIMKASKNIKEPK